MRHRQGPWILASAIALALLVSPLAIAAGEGNPLLGGKRNPGSNQSNELRSETQVIANTDTYGTRQSNKGSGGGAIYGCRSAPGSEPCLRGANLSSGRAFEFLTSGSEGGRIEASGGDGSRPFTTNATGVATGLNADRVDGLNAGDLVDQAAAKAAAGGPPAFRCPTGTRSFAGGCFEESARSAQSFAGASAECGRAGRRLPTTSELAGFREQGNISLSGAEMASDIVDGAGENPTVGYATVTDAGVVATKTTSTASAFRCVVPAVTPSS